MSGKPALWPWFGGAAFLIAFDQWTKYLIRSSFQVGESISLIGEDLIRLTYVLNPGVAFGLPVPSRTLLLIFGWTAAAALAVYLSILIRRRDALRWPILLFFSGAIGNSIDRTLYGEVTDFLDADFPDFIMDRWPVFNVADSCVTVGVLLVALLVLFDRRPAHSPSPHDLAPGSSAATVSSDDGTRSATSAD
ncbi:signal peptidase II [candidate division KSB1 bacterium]|nr:signal peptidase II [candidate division KSB1 bacterium]